MMLRRLTQVLCGGVLVLASSLNAQQPNAQKPPAEHPSGWIPTPGQGALPDFPTGPNAAGDACGGKFPDGGMPYFLRAETAEQRTARLGTAEDPGCNPDPATSFWRFGKEFKINSYERQWAVFSHGSHDENFIRPFGFVNSYREVYQQNPKWVWVWEAVPEVQKPIEEDLQKSTESNNRYSDRDVAYMQSIRSEFFELSTKVTPKTVRFEESSDGLPTSGSWRNALAVADMNGDGHVDIVAPPERAGGTGAPAIFLGDSKGHWKYWQQAMWPHPLDYGSVAAADFNKDGKMDLAFAVHLQGIFVVLGDGKGEFRDVSEGLPRDFPTRRLVVTDVDRDGNSDIVAVSEGPTALQNAAKTLGKIRVYYNRKNGKSWQGADLTAANTRVGGDYLTVGNLNGDKYPDIAAASIYFGSPDIIFLSKSAKQWSTLSSKDGTVIPFLSYYFASTAGRFSSKKNDDLILSYVRFWPGDVNKKLIPTPPVSEATGIDRISFASDGTAKRTPIARWSSKLGVSGMGSGDFDGDGNLDVMYTVTRSADEREAVLLLGDGKGNFARAQLDGLKMDRKVTYDVKVADVNRDGRPDVVVMFEADQATALSPRDGSIRVFLNRGAAPAARVAER